MSAKRKPSLAVAYWLKEIAASRKREKDYRKEGERIRCIYSGEKREETPFNILFSNTEVMLPAVYSAVPRPVVQRRYKDGDALGLAAAKAGQKVLEFLLDTNIDGYETFNEAMKATTLDALLPGRGVSTVQYDADLIETGTDPATESDEQPQGEPETEAAPPEPVYLKKSELVCCESQSWDRVLFGYARKWSKVPWMSVELYVDRPKATELFGAVIANQIKYTKGEESDEDDRKSGDEEDLGERKTALVYQIWDKDGGRKVRYVSPHYKDGYLKVQDDPLGLTGFFNCPRPLQFIDKTDDLVPTALYTLYENQANELNTLTMRINRIAKAIKARGIYDSSLGDDIGRLFDEADDTEMIPAEKAGSLAANGGLDKAIWFAPIEELIATLRELYTAREQCKQVIYEIIGISDILRGATKAEETATAQQIKTQFGSLRLKPKQAEVARYARDLLRIMLEIAATKFSQDTWAKMTGLPYLTDEQAMQATQVAQAAMAQGNGQPSQLLQQQITWKQVLDTLKDDIQRAYKVDIETNSTVEPEAVEDQRLISELMTAIGEFLQGVGPLVAQGVMPFETAQTMLLAITRRFRFGSEIEDQIRQMKPPTPQDDGEAQKMQQQMQDMQSQMQQMQGENQKLQTASAQKDMQHAASVGQLQTQLKESEANRNLDKRDADLKIKELGLGVREEQLAFNEKAAHDNVKRNADSVAKDLEHKKQVVGLEAKSAKKDMAVSKEVDSKLETGVKALQEMVGQLLQVVAEQGKQHEGLVKAITAPRVRTPKRGKDGSIESVTEEVAA